MWNLVWQSIDHVIFVFLQCRYKNLPRASTAAALWLLLPTKSFPADAKRSTGISAVEYEDHQITLCCGSHIGEGKKKRVHHPSAGVYGTLCLFRRSACRPTTSCHPATPHTPIARHQAHPELVSFFRGSSIGGPHRTVPGPALRVAVYLLLSNHTCTNGRGYSTKNVSY